MDERLSDKAFTDAIKQAQRVRGSREDLDDMPEEDLWHDSVTPALEQFLQARDSFYIATTSVDGQPYIQHRGGPPGFLKILDPKTLGFADFSGNRQYITPGNLSENDRAFIFLMDYANRRRIKLWGRAKIVEGDDALCAKLTIPGYRAKVERAILFEIEVWHANCPQHIVRRFPEADVAQAVGTLKARIADLEAELAELRGGV